MKRIVIAIIMIFSLITSLGLLTFFTFAVPQDGDQCTTDYINVLVGSDGGHFYRNGVQTSIRYYPDGSTGAFSHENYAGPRQHYMIKPDGEEDYYGYCIEQGESFPDAQRYSGVGWKNDSYFTNLPNSVQTGIMLATIFGWQPGKNVPVSGCNADDWYWATQVIIWEYQQKLRTSPTNIQSNGYVSSNYFQSTLAGRPAENCYHYMLKSMADYQVVPSFVSTDSANVSMIILKWDSIKRQWCVSLNDTNQSGYPLITNDPALKIERYGNQYTFTSSVTLDLRTIEFRKDVMLPSHEMLIWGGANTTQAITTGAADPMKYFAQFRTEQPGLIEILKTSEDGIKEGIHFTLVDHNGQITDLVTNQEGITSAQLYPGEYLVSEEQNIKYRIPETLTVTIKENETTNLEYLNILKRGQIQIQKKVMDTISGDSIAEKGAIFQIFSDKYITYNDTPSNVRDEITTDDQGIATSRELPLGNYIVHQSFAKKDITTSQDIPISLEEDLHTVMLDIKNQYQKGILQIQKQSNTQQPLAGGVFLLKTAEDIRRSDGTIRFVKGSLMDSLTTDENGLASSGWLYPGKYTLEETKAPDGYSLPKNPVTPVLMTADDQFEMTFFKQVPIINTNAEEFPMTGDEYNRINTKIILIMMVMSLIGIGVLASMMREQNKTLYKTSKKAKKS
jgi:hypothetical protein